MTNLESELCRILDFKPQYVDTACNEAISKEKLQGTWLYVNDKLVCAKCIKPLSNVVEGILCGSVKGLTKFEVQKLDVFLPESGLYTTNLGIICVGRKTHKSWTKSFSPSNYYVHYLDSDATVSAFVYPQLIKDNLCYTALDNKGLLYVYGNYKAIGKLDKEANELVVLNPEFYQEAVDFVNRKGFACHVILQ